MKKAQILEQGSARIVLVTLVSFCLGVGVTALWFHRVPAGNANAANAETAAPEQVGMPAPPPAPAPVVTQPQPIDPAVMQEVKQQVPNFATISLEDGEQILRTAALKAFADASAETDDQMNAARQKLQDAQNNGSAADQQSAMKHVQDVQAAGADKLKEIAARLQAQITALKNLKDQQ